MDEPEFEFKFVQGDGISVQKTLNQWKHQFTVRVESMHMSPEGDVTMLCRRYEGVHSEYELEYRLLSDKPAIVQKTLNQWKHMYMIDIEATCYVGDSGFVSMLITRTKKA